MALATDPNNPDHDGDTICDGSGTGGGSCTAGPDNCPFISNPSQTNSDALEAGDDCQCGDVNRDNTVTVLDLVIVRQNLVGVALSGSFDASRCDFDGDPGCGVDDAFVLDRIAATDAAMHAPDPESFLTVHRKAVRRHVEGEGGGIVDEAQGDVVQRDQ